MGRKGEIESRLEELLRELSRGDHEITAGTDLKSLDIDSLDLAELAQAMTEEFNAEAPTERLERVRTVGELVDLVAAHAH